MVRHKLYGLQEVINANVKCAYTNGAHAHITWLKYNVIGIYIYTAIIIYYSLLLANSNLKDKYVNHC